MCVCACVLWSEHVPVSDVLDSWLSVPLDYYNPGLEYMVWPREIISLLFLFGMDAMSLKSGFIIQDDILELFSLKNTGFGSVNCLLFSLKSMEARLLIHSDAKMRETCQQIRSGTTIENLWRFNAKARYFCRFFSSPALAWDCFSFYQIGKRDGFKYSRETCRFSFSIASI